MVSYMHELKMHSTSLGAETLLWAGVEADVEIAKTNLSHELYGMWCVGMCTALQQ